jgi:hypothetical protein
MDKGPYDGQLLTYIFGSSSSSWKTDAISLKKAQRAFRIGAMYPHTYSNHRVKTQYGSNYDDVVYLSSEAGATVPVHVSIGGAWKHVTDIEPEGAEAEYGPDLLAAQSHIQIASEAMGMETSAETSIAVAGANLSAQSRRGLEDATFDLKKRMASLDLAKRKMEMEVAQMRAELKRRMEQIWMIELFLGSNEEVKRLREGIPAPVSEPISVRQQVLCMDEEIAVYDWLENPERIGEFDYNHIDDFDAWLLADPAHLDAIFPHQKGIVGLRVRRRAKQRGEAQGYMGLSGAFQAHREEQWDKMTYLLVRNGENLYRLWVDIQMFPRLFSSAKDFEPVEGHNKRVAARWTERDMKEKQKTYFAGLLVIQGLIERSDLLHPLPKPDLSVVKPEHQKYFNLVRDGEEFLMLADPDDPFSNLTWRIYNKWLKSQLRVGTRVLYTGPTYFSKDRDRRATGHAAPPDKSEIFTLDEEGGGAGRASLSFLYLPKDKVYNDDGWGSHPRKNRVRWSAYSDELIPVDVISWRVLEHLIRDRNNRGQYGSFFLTAFRWWARKKKEQEREKPFVDLVLAQGGASSDADRARCERLLRWWKMKTKTHRTLGEDEPKALRMILKAFLRGDDHDNDPETALHNLQGA